MNRLVFQKASGMWGLWAMVLLLPLAAGIAGCEAFAFGALMWGKEPTKNVAAEYPYLADKKVCLLVRAEMETLFEYPQVQWEVADHVRVTLEGSVRGLTTVDPRRVVDFQRRTADWEKMDPAGIGKRFGADRLLEIDLTQYTTREPESPHLYRGHISALVSVYNTDYPNSEPAYSKEVQTVYPPNSPGEWGTGDRAIRRATLEAFAQDVAGRFYDRKVKVK
ncbi:MAG: hypothetical protein KAY37_05430 [Phycisphaerae bacterium]|nr:hypothetical protein [Phycisphaerae bacterium]